MHVYRGLEYETEQEVAAARMEFDKRIGKTFTLQGLVSTSYSADYAHSFATRHGGASLMFRIKAKTGLAGFNEREFEVLQDHGTRYRVLGTSTSPSGTRDGDLHVVDVEEVLPGEEEATPLRRRLARPPRRPRAAPLRSTSIV